MDARRALTAVSMAAGAVGAVAAVVGARRVAHAAEADAAVADDLLSGYEQALERLDPELVSVLAAEIAWDEWPLTVDTAGEPHYCAALGCSWSSSDDVTFLDTPEAWRERGADRFAGGYIRAPFIDLGDDFTADRARAWLAGWDAANLATPVDLP